MRHELCEHAWLALHDGQDVPSALALQPLFRLEGPGSNRPVDTGWSPPVPVTQHAQGAVRFDTVTLNVQTLAAGSVASQAHGLTTDGKALALAEQFDKLGIAVVALQECRARSGIHATIVGTMSTAQALMVTMGVTCGAISALQLAS